MRMSSIKSLSYIMCVQYYNIHYYTIHLYIQYFIKIQQLLYFFSTKNLRIILDSLYLETTSKYQT